MKKNKLVALFSAVKSIFEEMASIETDKGVLYYEGELAVGTVVYNESGIAPDGEYVSDGKKYKVENGVISEIEAVEPEEKPVEVPAEGEMACGAPKKMEAEEPVQEEPKVEEPKEEPKEESKEESKIDELMGEIASLKDMIAALENRMTQIDARLVDIEKAPADVAPHEEFSRLKGIEAVKAMRAANRVK